MIVTAGSTNVSVYFYVIQDAGATNPGEPVTGLLFSDIETGGSASYLRQGAARSDLTLVTLASASAVHTDGGFILVDNTNMPGLYRCDFPDAAFTTGVDQVILQLVVASANNAIVTPLLVDITDVDLRDSVRGGMTALPNFDADDPGGLPISMAGSLDLDLMSLNIDDIEADLANGTDGLGAIKSDTAAILVDTSTTLDGALAIIDANVDQIETAVITNAAGPDIAADIIAIKAETSLIVADTNELQTDDIPGLIGALNDPSAALIADTVLDEDMTGHQTLGSLGQAIGDPAVNNKSLYDAIITDASGLSVTQDVAIVDVVVDGIQADLDNATDGLGALETIMSAVLVDTNTTIPGSLNTLQIDTDDIQSRLPASLSGGNMSSDVMAIVTSTIAANNLKENAETIIVGSATPVTLSTTQMSADGFTEATDDHFIGRIIIWTSGQLIAQASDITDYEGSSQTFTFTATTEAPVDNDTFVIV